jgi:hypothetical protein
MTRTSYSVNNFSRGLIKYRRKLGGELNCRPEAGLAKALVERS